MTKEQPNPNPNPNPNPKPTPNQVSRMTKEQQLGVVGYKGSVPPGPGAYNHARTAFVISHRRPPH